MADVRVTEPCSARLGSKFVAQRTVRPRAGAAAARGDRKCTVRAHAGDHKAAGGPVAEAAPPAVLMPRVGGGRQKVSMMSLGCPKNVVDGEVLLGDLFREGFDIVKDHEEADAIVVNTCAFIDEAKEESIAAIFEAAQLKTDGKAKRVVVTGCLAQRYGAELAGELPEVDLIMGFQEYPKLSNELHSALGTKKPAKNALPTALTSAPSSAPSVLVGSATVPFRAEWDRHALTPRHMAYMRVAEGCDHKCTFCAIPGFRGKFRSKPWDAVMDEARRLAASGVRELNLIAEDTNQYGMDLKAGYGLAELLRAVSEIPGIEWIRILYAYPSYFTDALIDEIASNDKVVKYIDIPLQHISGPVLLAMNRPHREHTETLLRKLRARIPGLVLRSTFICGFPGEREEDHRELVNFCKEFQFERLGAFQYSSEDGTPAASYPDQIPQEEREARRDEVVSIQQGISERFAQRRVGTEAMVLIDSVDEEEEGVFIGRTALEAPDVDPVVFLSDVEGAEPLAVGQMRLCRFTGASINDLVGHPVK